MTLLHENPAIPSGKPKLLDQVRYRCRLRHLALSTEDAYVGWIRVSSTCRSPCGKGKGDKDRVTLLPEAAVEPLQRHLTQVRDAHERALREGYGGVELPYALGRKYPRADREWGWQ